MIKVMVEHFLNDKGKAYFPEWIAEVKEALLQFEGFQSIRQLNDVQNSNRSLLLLSFKNLELLRQWSQSQMHENKIAKLQPHMLQKQQSQIFEVKEMNQLSKP